MISNPNWHKPKIKPYLHQISLDCLSKLVECMESCEIGEIDTNACCELEKQILTDEIDDSEFLNFAIENFEELLSYIKSGNLNIRIHRDITGEMWFGVGVNFV